MLLEIARAINASSLHHGVVALLKDVWGLPPIVQTVHLLSIAVVMGSIVMIDLKVLGLALPSQNLNEMWRRLMPWLWCALLTLFFSGAVFVIARPGRYATSIIFGIKMTLLLVAIVTTIILQRLHSKAATTLTLRLVAGVSLTAWIGVMLAGRWIAYADYLFPPE